MVKASNTWSAAPGNGFDVVVHPQVVVASDSACRASSTDGPGVGPLHRCTRASIPGDEDPYLEGLVGRGVLTRRTPTTELHTSWAKGSGHRRVDGHDLLVVCVQIDEVDPRSWQQRLRPAPARPATRPTTHRKPEVVHAGACMGFSSAPGR